MPRTEAPSRNTSRFGRSPAYLRSVGGFPRILVATGPADGLRARALIAELTLPFDVELLIHPGEEPSLAAWLREQEEPPAALLAEDLTADLARDAYAAGACVCLFAHGPLPLEQALLRVARERDHARATRAALARVEDELTVIFDGAPIALVILDTAGRIIRTNAAFERFVGKTARELGSLELAALEPEGTPRTVDELRRSLFHRTGEYQRRETRYRRGDGTIATGLESLSRASGFAVVTIEDISARVAMEQAVRASETVRALVNVSVTDVVFHLRVEGDRFRFIEINPAFTRATGLGEASVVGKFADEVIPEPSYSLAAAKYRQAVAERRTIRWDEITEYPSGKRYGQGSVTPVVEADGVCRALVGTVTDVTEARQHQQTIELYANVVSAVQIGLTVWSVDDPDDVAAITLIAVNPAAEKMAGISLKIGARLLDVFPKAGNSEIVDLLCDVARDGGMRELRASRLRASGGQRTLAVKGCALPGGSVGLAVEDVTAETRARALSADEQRVLEMAASGETFARTLEALTNAVEAFAPPVIASIMLLSEDGKRVVHGAAPNLPEEYNRAIEGAPIGPSAGSCGTAAYLRRSVIVADIMTDPLWELYRDLAKQFGLRACWSTPIFGPAGRVLGTFALYYREPRIPTEEELDLISRVNHVAGIVIQRHELDEQLRGLAAKLEMVREEERTSIARDIHDQLGQNLTALNMDIAWIERRAVSAEGIAGELLRGKLRELRRMTDGIINDVRRISAALRPTILDDLGLAAALMWQAEEFEKRTHIPCELYADVHTEQPRGEVATTVFRVFQETLTNVQRHAGATRVEAHLQQTDDAVVLEVRDDGQGIRDEDLTDPRSLGLLGIRERTRRLGGTASFARVTPHGTLVTLRIPLPRTHP